MAGVALLGNWIVNDYAALIRRGAEPYPRHPMRVRAVAGLVALWGRGEMDAHEARRCLRAVVLGEMDELWR